MRNPRNETNVRCAGGRDLMTTAVISDGMVATASATMSICGYGFRIAFRLSGTTGIELSVHTHKAPVIARLAAFAKASARQHS